jgi:hypothetical protein
MPGGSTAARMVTIPWGTRHVHAERAGRVERAEKAVAAAEGVAGAGRGAGEPGRAGTWARSAGREAVEVGAPGPAGVAGEMVVGVVEEADAGAAGGPPASGGGRGRSRCRCGGRPR